ncbi:CopZ family metallochaperone [Pirellulaceae bacterium SH501]
MNNSRQTKIFQVTGMTCSHCKKAVETAIQSTPGVQETLVELESGKATVTGQFSNEAIVMAIEDAGYSAELLPGE